MHDEVLTFSLWPEQFGACGDMQQHLDSTPLMMQ
jgi:hypothetical protein